MSCLPPPETIPSRVLLSVLSPPAPSALGHGGMVGGHSEIAVALGLAAGAWFIWTVLVLAETPNPGKAGRHWFAAFLALKGLNIWLCTSLGQATGWDREALHHALYPTVGALAYACWWMFLRCRGSTPTARQAPLLGLGALALWLASAAIGGPMRAWQAWPWFVALPVFISTLWFAWRERRWAFVALAGALAIEFTDESTVLAWHDGFPTQLAFSWAQLMEIPPELVNASPPNGLIVEPVTITTLAWFLGMTLSLWTGVLLWARGSGVKRTRLIALSSGVLFVTAVCFLFFRVSMVVSLLTINREVRGRMSTLASVAPPSDAPATPAWNALRRKNSDLGLIFRVRISHGQRIILDPLAEHLPDALPVLPFERESIDRGEFYSLGIFRDRQGASLYGAMPMGNPSNGTSEWLAIITPLERFYLYHRPSALLAVAVNILFALVAITGFGYALHREREQRHRLAREDAEAAVKIQTTFLAKVSHELRTPLQSLLGYTELLRPSVIAPIAQRHLASLQQHTELMLRLVNDLLDLTAIETGAFQLLEKPVALGELVRQTVDNLGPRAEIKGLVLRTRVDPRLPEWVMADAERTRQIVLNLVGNAVKFTERGQVDVAVEVVTDDIDRPKIEISVRDTGPGIAPDQQSRLFQPFSRLDLVSAKEGSGLGLALTAALCRSAGGSVSVESDGRSGACFRAQLLLRPADPPAPPSRPLLATLRGKRVLIADDNALVRHLFSTYLSSLGAECDDAIDGEQALSRVDLQNYDAIVLDLAMPRVDGLEVARRLHARGVDRRTLRIVGVSAHASPADRARALAAGMDVFLSKPVELAHLASALTLETQIPKISPRPELKRELEQLFRADAAAQLGSIDAAFDRQDWPALRARAHYIKNSAAVLCDDALFAACSALEDAAESKDHALCNRACTAISKPLSLWLTEQSRPNPPAQKP